MRGNEIDHRLVDPFLGHILVSYKVDDMDLETAVSKIAFLVAAVALPEGERANPTKYMQAVLAGEHESNAQHPEPPRAA